MKILTVIAPLCSFLVIAGCEDAPSARAMPAPARELSEASEASSSHAGVSGPLVATDRGWRLAAPDASQGWQPIRPDVEVAGFSGGGVEVSYLRQTGAAFGIAHMLPEGATAGLKSIEIKGSGTPAQRLYVCLTDANGIVWSFPTLRLTEEAKVHRLNTDDVRPDTFQNAGKTPPVAPNWQEMKMLTLLDISGHMGGRSVECEWRIESLEGVTR